MASEIPIVKNIVAKQGNENIGSKVHSQEEDFELKVGKTVADAEAAYNLYNRYAINKGFSVRKGKIRYKQGTSIVRERIFYCSKEGIKRDEDPGALRKLERLETRTGCSAHVRFKVENGIWELDRLVSEHNHVLAPPEQRHLLRSGRKIMETSKDVITSMASAGIRPTIAYKYMANEAGGVRNVGFTKRDHSNLLQAEKRKHLGSGDAQTLVDHFKRKQTEDPMFFYAVQVDEDNRMKNFFWRDGMSKMDYECFGDVVIFDTTYRTNKYNMICAPFVGVNHHWKNVFFGCAFLSDETIPTFIWLLETFKVSMGNKAPMSIFTDQDHAMRSAIKEVFSKTRHRLCIWHILRNAGNHISHLLAKPGFKDKFNKLFYNCESDIEFEFLWNDLVEKWEVDKNKWIKKLYDIRENWCSCFSQETFSADIKSTQRSESTNNIFQQMACKTMTLTEFVRHYDEKTKEMRETENIDDFSSNQSRPYMHVRCGIIEHAAEVYTHKVFRMFQEEFFKGVSEQVVDYVSDGTHSTYVLRKDGRLREHRVDFNSWNSAVHCSCKMFESKGWLCSHALRVLNFNLGIKKIPPQYVLDRWTKQAKRGIMMEIFEMANSRKKTSKTIRLNKLMRKAFFVMNISAEDESTEEIASENLDRILSDIGKYKENGIVHVEGGVNSISIDILGENRILDPPCKRAKGEKNMRLKGALERNRKKKITKETLHGDCSTNSLPKELSPCKFLFRDMATSSKSAYTPMSKDDKNDGDSKLK